MSDEPTTKTGYILEDDEVMYGTWDIDTPHSLHPDHIFNTPDELFETYIAETREIIQDRKRSIKQLETQLATMNQLYLNYLRGTK